MDGTSRISFVGGWHCYRWYNLTDFLVYGLLAALAAGTFAPGRAWMPP